MSTVTEPWGALNPVTIALNSLANGNYVAGSAVDVTSIDPLDIGIEVTLNPGIVSGNKQALLFVKTSVNGTDYTTGPESGTTTTDEPNLYFVGSIPLNTSSTPQRKYFPLMQALGFVPPYFKSIIKNESGAALSGSGNSMNYNTLTGNIA